VTEHCICKSVYSPENDVQRYCLNCAQWYDVDCIKRKKVKSAGRDAGQDVAKKIASMPILRGALGSSEKQWRICGSGRKIAKVKEWGKKRRFPEDWEERLGESFVNYAHNTSFSRYRCPTPGCGTII